MEMSRAASTLLVASPLINLEFVKMQWGVAGDVEGGLERDMKA
jgi:hypothetical protein